MNSNIYLISVGNFCWGTEREIILKPIWHIYVDKLFKGIIALSINMFVYWNRIVFGFTSSCLITLWLWKTVLIHMVMSKKKIHRLKCFSFLQTPNLAMKKTLFSFVSEHWNLAFSAKLDCIICYSFPHLQQIILKKNKAKSKMRDGCLWML